MKDLHSLEENHDLWTVKEGEKWTLKYPELGTGTVDFNRMVSPEFYELEKEAVFRRSWLNIGTLQDLPKPGCYFTKEMEVCNTSILVTRGRDDKVYAFHNVCPHRGNRLVWETHPKNEVSGKTVRFFCKYHGLGYDLDGKVAHVTDKDNYFGDQVCNLKLPEIACEVWNGFIFINLDPDGPSESLASAIGEYYWSKFDFPFDKYTERYTNIGECDSNWKTLSDAFAEGYHAAYLHKWTFPMQADPDIKDVNVRQDHFSLHGRHHLSMVRRMPQGMYSYDIEKMTRANAMSPQIRPQEEPLPEAANPIRQENWGCSSSVFFPNLFIQFYYPNVVVVYRYWPLASNRMRFEVEHYLKPAETFSELLSHYGYLTLFRETALQDVNLLEATQLGLDSHAVQGGFPLQDEEILVRHLHHAVDECVAQYKAKEGLS